MEDTTNPEIMSTQASPLFTFDSPKGQSAFIKVIGVGGGGGNAVNHMFREGITGVDFIVCNTDMKALGASPVPNKIPLGTLGLGAGGKPEKARKAAMDKADDIRDALSHNTQMLFITAGMGGGTGTGAAPVIAEIAKSIKLENEENEEILVVAIVTRPFTFEGRERKEQAEAGIKALRDKVDSIIIIDNDKLFAYGDLTMSQAYALADDVLLTAAKGIAEIISKEGYICRDFQDIKSVMEHSGKALMGTGSGSGENRAKDAIDAATRSVLLDDSDITGAKNVLLYFTSSHEHEMRIREQMEITDYVCQATGGFADVKYGAGYDDELGEELRVTLIATGFDKDLRKEVASSTDTVAKKEEEKNTVPKQPETPEEPTLIKHEEKTTEKPVNKETAAPKDNSIRIIKLDEDEPKATTKNKVENPVNESELIDGIRLITKDPVTPAPAPAPAPAPKPAPVNVASTHETPSTKVETKPAVDDVPHTEEKPSTEQTKTTVATYIKDTFHSTISTLDAAERIRKIHELLRNDPSGADKVQSMTTQQIAEGSMAEIYNFVPHSSKMEASRFAIQSNGKMTEVPTLQAKAD